MKISLPLPPIVYKMLFLIPLYFGFAVVYDVYSTIHDIVLEHSVSPGKVITQGVPTGIIKNTTLMSDISTTVIGDYFNTTVPTHWTTTTVITPT